MFAASLYLDRIGCSGDLDPTLATLRSLQYQHLLNIPFENLDIHYDTPIVLETDKLFEKIIAYNRGGFCYELNGLFFALLDQIGFKARMISARVHEENGHFSPEFDHMALIVTIDNTNWLVDVGFGDFTYSPLNIASRNPQDDPRGTFRITDYEPDPNYLLVQKKNEKDDWENEYIFSGQSRSLSDFEDRCHFHQTSTESHFSKKKVCSRVTENGRITVTQDCLKIEQNNSTFEKPVTSKEEFESLISKHFGFDII